MEDWNTRGDAQRRSYFGKPGLFSFLLIIGFILYFFFS